MSYAKLSPKALGLALGLFWALIVLSFGILAHFSPIGITFINSVQTIYVGYSIDWSGIAIGTALAFIHLFVKGFIAAVIYNLFV